jgi:quercetin dioxygenase-like cupin family protein
VIVMQPAETARTAVAPHANRPATYLLHDAPDVRLVTFVLAAGQSVPPHRNSSSVLLTVLSGQGMISGEADERVCVEGDIVAFGPNELHGMRAIDEEFLVLAAITPRPGSR